MKENTINIIIDDGIYLDYKNTDREFRQNLSRKFVFSAEVYGGKLETINLLKLVDYDGVAVKIANELKHEVIGFSILGDAGATYTKEKVENAFLSAKKGEIVIIHMNHPQSQTADGTIKAIKELKEKGFRFVRLSDYKLK